MWNRCEGRGVRLRSVKPKMPTACKALEIERWRGTRKPGLYLAWQPRPAFALSLTPDDQDGCDCSVYNIGGCTPL